MCGVGLSNMVTLSRVKFKERQSPWALSSQPVNEDSQAREVAVNPPTSAKLGAWVPRWQIQPPLVAGVGFVQERTGVELRKHV
jgi:hypothetical protein